MSNQWNKLQAVIESRRAEDSGNTTTSLQYEAFTILSQVTHQLVKFPELCKKIDQFKDCLYRPLQVAVVGEYGAGKSTFLNAILQESVLPTGDLPTTGCVNYIRFGNAPSIVAHYKDDSSESLSSDQLQYISTHDHTNTHKQHLLQQIKYIEVFKSAKILEKVVFVDTPGLNAPTEADREITEKLLNESDAILWLTSARQVLAATEVEVLEAFSDRYKGKSLCVISQVDSLNNPKREIPQLLQYAKKTLSDYFTDIVAVSALEAINGNEASMNPFYTAFWRDIIPRSQEMVVQTILLDAKNLVERVVKDVQEKQTRIKKLQVSLTELQQKAGNITNEMLEGIKGLRETSAREFRRLQDQLITRIQQECTILVDSMPYVYVSGIFWPSYEVKYVEVKSWHWEIAKVNQANEWVTTKAESIMETFFKQSNQLVDSFVKARDQLDTIFENQNEDIVVKRLGLNAQNEVETMFHFNRMIRDPYLYFSGAMKHGGVLPISWGILLDRSENRPGANNVTKFVKYWLPFDKLIQITEQNEKEFIESTQAGVNAHYKWLEEKLSGESQQMISLMEELQMANGCLLS